MPRWNMLQTAFLDAGYSAETIDTVLCTHLHVDHVGWNTRLVDTRWVPTFPNACYLSGRTEWKHWSSGPDPALIGDAPPEIAQNVMEASAVYEGSIRPIVDAGPARTRRIRSPPDGRDMARTDARPFAWSCQRAHFVERQGGHDHRRSHASSDSVRTAASHTISTSG